MPWSSAISMERASGRAPPTRPRRAASAPRFAASRSHSRNRSTWLGSRQHAGCRSGGATSPPTTRRFPPACAQQAPCCSARATYLPHSATGSRPTRSTAAPPIPGIRAGPLVGAVVEARRHSRPGSRRSKCSDIGGSIRVPAAFCGIYGHRPSETLLPRSGQFPMPPLPNAAVVMGVQGPLARSAKDLELALSVLAGPDVGEDVAWRVELPPARHDRLADFRVAVLPPIHWLGVDGQITAALDELASRLGPLGCAVKQSQPEPFGDHREHHSLYRSLLSAVTSARVDEETRRKR